MAQIRQRKHFITNRRCTSTVDHSRSCRQLMILCTTWHNWWGFWLVVWEILHLHILHWFFFSIHCVNLKSSIDKWINPKKSTFFSKIHVILKVPMAITLMLPVVLLNITLTTWLYNLHKVSTIGNTHVVIQNQVEYTSGSNYQHCFKTGWVFSTRPTWNYRHAELHI